jgi:hypothetical protein
MPAQELFLDTVINGRKIQVVKTYDQAYATEVFRGMSDEAKAFLWKSLKPEELYDPVGLPTEPGIEYDAFLLEEMIDQGREEWNSFSYFVVMDAATGQNLPTFVSPDWPTAETFANAPQSPHRDMPHRPNNPPSQGLL